MLSSALPCRRCSGIYFLSGLLCSRLLSCGFFDASAFFVAFQALHISRWMYGKTHVVSKDASVLEMRCHCLCVPFDDPRVRVSSRKTNQQKSSFMFEVSFRLATQELNRRWFYTVNDLSFVRTSISQISRIPKSRELIHHVPLPIAKFCTRGIFLKRTLRQTSSPRKLSP